MPPGTPFTDHVTAVLVEPLTVAPNGWAADTWTEAFVGETEIDTGGGVDTPPVTLTIAIETLAGSVALWADIVKGTVAASQVGAV